MSTRVRLADGNPAHELSEEDMALWNRWKGRWIELGKPEAPASDTLTTDCGTDLVWPVIGPQELIDEHPGMVSYVCRHQIQAGD